MDMVLLVSNQNLAKKLAVGVGKPRLSTWKWYGIAKSSQARSANPKERGVLLAYVVATKDKAQSSIRTFSDAASNFLRHALA